MWAKCFAFVVACALTGTEVRAQSLKLPSVPRGEYSLTPSQIWTVTGSQGFEFDIATDANGRRPVLTMSTAMVDMLVAGQWKRIPGNSFINTFKPGYLLPIGHYRISNFTSAPGQLSGYWANATSVKSVEGDDVFLAQDRLLCYWQPLDTEFTVPATGVYFVTHIATNALYRWDGAQWVQHFYVQGEGQIAGPGFLLVPGRYRTDANGWLLGYKLSP